MSLIARPRRSPPDQISLAQHLNSAQLFVKKRKNLVRLVDESYVGFFLQMTDQRIFEASTLKIEFYGNLIIAINSLGDF